MNIIEAMEIIHRDLVQHGMIPFFDTKYIENNEQKIIELAIEIEKEVKDDD